jgi:hypothetical protein
MVGIGWDISPALAALILYARLDLRRFDDRIGRNMSTYAHHPHLLRCWPRTTDSSQTSCPHYDQAGGY